MRGFMQLIISLCYWIKGIPREKVQTFIFCSYKQGGRITEDVFERRFVSSNYSHFSTYVAHFHQVFMFAL